MKLFATLIFFYKLVASKEKDEMEEIIERIALYYGINKEPLLYSRKNKFTTIRHMIWYYCHNVNGVSVFEMAKRFRCTTRAIFLGIRKIKDGVSRQRFYKDSYTEFLTIINSCAEGESAPCTAKTKQSAP